MTHFKERDLKYIFDKSALRGISVISDNLTFFACSNSQSIHSLLLWFSNFLDSKVASSNPVPTNIIYAFVTFLVTFNECMVVQEAQSLSFISYCVLNYTFQREEFEIYSC